MVSGETFQFGALDVAGINLFDLWALAIRLFDLGNSFGGLPDLELELELSMDLVDGGGLSIFA